jgi:outer membrane murein-binding lipoprotein Lpp
MTTIQRNSRVNTVSFEKEELSAKEISLVYDLQQLHLQVQATAEDIKNKNLEIKTMLSN